MKIQEMTVGLSSAKILILDVFEYNPEKKGTLQRGLYKSNTLKILKLKE